MDFQAVTLHDALEETARVAGGSKALARKVGPSPVEVCDWGVGRQVPSAETTAMLAESAQLPVEGIRRLVHCQVVAQIRDPAETRSGCPAAVVPRGVVALSSAVLRGAHAWSY